MSKHHHSDGLDDAQQRAAQARKEIEMSGKFNLPEGKSEVRILQTPPDEDRESPAVYIENQFHRDWGPHKRFVKCGNRPGESGKCWGCRKRDKKKKEGRTKEAAKMNPIKMIAVQVAVKDRDLGEFVGPFLWQVNEGKRADALGYKILGIVSNRKMKKYLDHKHGYNYTFNRVGQGRDTRYGDVERDDEPSAVPKQILKRLVPFADLDMRTYDEEYMKQAYYGNEPTKDNKENDEDMPKAGKKKKTRREEESSDTSDDEEEDASSSASDEASDEDESDESSASDDTSGSDDEDSSDESSASDDESEEDESDASGSDDDDEDEKPKKGKGKKSKKDESDESDESDGESSDTSDSSDEASDEEESSDASDDEKPKRGKGKQKRKPRSDKGKKRKPRRKK